MARGGYKSIIIWGIKSGNKIKILHGITGYVNCLVALPDGFLASCSDDNTIIIWDIESGNKIMTLADHTNSVRSLVVLPDGSLASGSFDGEIIKWNDDKN